VHRDVEAGMKRALLLMMACSSKSAAPSAGSAAPPAPVVTPAPAMKPAPPPPMVDLPAAGVSKLVVHPTNDPANEMFAGWNALARNVTMACREDAYNLVSFDGGDPDGTAAGTHRLVWIPDPFVTAPHLCELRFYDDKNRITARACWRDGELQPQECPMPRVKVPEPAVVVNVEGASVHSTGKTVELRALVTLEAEAPGRHFAFALRCDGVAGKPFDNADVLARLDAGDTRFVRLMFDLAKPVAAPKQCQLDITDPKRVSTFCIADGSTEAGPCHS
jgi:hypothetical protein